MAKRSKALHSIGNRKKKKRKTDIKIAKNAVKMHCLKFTKRRENKLELGL